MEKINFWSNKKVLITGHSGFKGAWLSTSLGEKGAEVYGLSDSIDRIDSEQRLTLLQILDPQLKKEYLCDLRDQELTEKILFEIQPDIVIHLAAQALVDRAYQDPYLTFSTNFMGTLNLIEACSRFLQKLSNHQIILLNVTTDKVYSQFTKNHVTETSPLFNPDPYGASKTFSDQLGQVYQNLIKSKNFKIITARSGNVIGGGDFHQSRLIPYVMNQYFLGQKIQIKTPNSIRPWQHVFDVLRGYEKYCEHSYLNLNNVSPVLNFGPDLKQHATVGEALNIIQQKTSGSLIWQKMDHSNLKDIDLNDIVLDSSKAKSVLDWMPKWDLKQSLDMTLQWYGEYFKNPKNRVSLRNLSYEQFQSYNQINE